MLNLYRTQILNAKLCLKFERHCSILCRNRQLFCIFNSPKYFQKYNYSENDNSVKNMARRSNFPPGLPRLDYNGPPHPIVEFNYPPRMPFHNPRIEFSAPPRMDFNNEDSFRQGRPFRGPTYVDDSDDFRRPHMRVHCGELREHHAGMIVEISGRVNKQRLGRFLTLKDVNGITQLVVPDSKPYLVRKVTNIPLDSYLVVNGTVSKRPKHQRNMFMNTGNVEVIINKIINITVNKFKNTKDALLIGAMQTRNNSTISHSLSLTSEEFKRCASQSVSSQFSKRTHNCSELCAHMGGTAVVLCGWIESKQGRFVHLRDGYGMIQVVIPTSNTQLTEYIKNIDIDTIVQITGKVNMRPEHQRNMTVQTGDVEVYAEEIKEIVPCDTNTNVEEMTIENSASEKNNVNSFTTRTHNCGQLRKENVGQMVTLSGWLEFHRVGKFVILRDGYGRTQLVIPDERKDIQKLVDCLPYESIIEVTGFVTSRPPSSEQKAMETGKIEVVINNLKVLNIAKRNLPFNVREHNKAKEPLRMEHRYLDLRFSDMQRNLRTRSKFLMNMREFLINQAEFVEVETPTLFKTTPGGAQEFIVPTRTPGHFYSLVQSPQQFKQMLMSGSIDRYFQIARCYRDEGARPDRQPEFTQLDIEMSFTTVNGILTLIERLLKYSWPKDLPNISIPFERMSFQDAILQYGTDKPDIRFESKLTDCTEILKTNGDLVNDENFAAYAVIFKKPCNGLTVSLKAIYDEIAKSYPKTKLLQARFAENIHYWIKETSKSLGDIIPSTLAEYLKLEEETVLFLAYGNKKEVLSLLGKIRVEYINYLEDKGQILRNKEDMKFLWITDFPLFEEGEDSELLSAHHPFTAPHPDNMELLQTEPLKVRGQSYDLVLNGVEVGGGSIRIHDPELQIKIFQKLKIKAQSMEHLLNALSSGCPPHGGIALGLDRLIATMLNTNSIRDVIAFPKGVEGKDPLSGAPVKISDKDKKLYHLEIVKDNIKDINHSLKKSEFPRKESFISESGNHS